MTNTPYTDSIREGLVALGGADLDPAVIEAWMRLEHGTLDGLSHRQFREEIATACACARLAGPKVNLQLAQSYGLREGATP
jgi:hypothetical protein